MGHAPRHARLACVALTFPLVLAAACSLVDPEGQDITLVSRMSQPLVYLAVELETSHRMDPIPGFTIGLVQERWVPPGASVTVADRDVLGYRRGDDVRIFLYTVAHDTAVLAGMLTLTHRELRRRGFHIEVSEGSLARSSPWWAPATQTEHAAPGERSPARVGG